jgi:hypothetical protein
MKASAMNEQQRAMLLDLISEWAGIVHESAAAARMAEIKAGLGETWFAWSGPTTVTPGATASVLRKNVVRTSWLKLQRFVRVSQGGLRRFVSSRSSRRGSLQHVFMTESAQYRCAANDVAGGDTVTASICRRGMRERHWYPQSQAHVRPWPRSPRRPTGRTTRSGLHPPRRTRRGRNSLAEI